jgi:hypothetical protein
MLSPNTLTLPFFPSRLDADLNVRIYKRTGVLSENQLLQTLIRGGPIRRYLDMNKADVLALCHPVRPGIPSEAR